MSEEETRAALVAAGLAWETRKRGVNQRGGYYLWASGHIDYRTPSSSLCGVGPHLAGEVRTPICPKCALLWYRAQSAAEEA